MWLLSLIDAAQNEIKEIQNNTKCILHVLSEEVGERTLRKYDNLNKSRQFIYNYLQQNNDNVYEEKYLVDNLEVSNIIAEIPGFEHSNEIIIIGAHYDTIEDTSGADDNGSAVAGLLELHRMLSQYTFRKTLRFVAFTLEEPPFFSGPYMGSMVHALGCKDKGENINLMICLEMIGYAGNRMQQDYPLRSMQNEYPPYGNFLAVVSLPSYAPYAYKWKKEYNKYAKNKIVDMIGPASIPGINLSDHYSFNKFGFPAIMITDTAFYRNKNYHTEGDTYGTINFKFLSESIFNTFMAVKTLSNERDILDE
ncbi:MAG TPA: M28 family peptidase [Spirochaetota bacterium]|nr:M28 family peptidase [Spirochaetota bacterium]